MTYLHYCNNIILKTTINTILQLYASCDILGQERWQACNVIAQFSVKFKNQCVCVIEEFDEVC